ncbi:unnamed protein product [Trichobilharzia regenti]|nr:unnamed protein product [Trichobilharzia regenti]
MPATSLLTTSSPSLEDNIHTSGYSTRNSIKSIDDNVGNTIGNDACIDVSRHIDEGYKEDHEQLQQMNNGLTRKSLNNYSVDNTCSNNALEKYPSMMVDDDDVSYAVVCVCVCASAHISLSSDLSVDFLKLNLMDECMYYLS